MFMLIIFMVIIAEMAKTLTLGKFKTNIRKNCIDLLSSLFFLFLKTFKIVLYKKTKCTFPTLFYKQSCINMPHLIITNKIHVIIIYIISIHTYILYMFTKQSILKIWKYIHIPNRKPQPFRYIIFKASIYTIYFCLNMVSCMHNIIRVDGCFFFFCSPI